MPFGVNCLKVKFGDLILDRIRQRLAIQKCKLPSMASRLELIKYTVNNLPIYYQSTFKFPNSIAKRIVSIQRKFLRGGDDQNNKLITVAWKMIEAPKDFGGLGVGSLKLKNLGLLVKRCWRYCNTDASLWKKVIQSINNLPNKFMSYSELSQI